MSDSASSLSNIFPSGLSLAGGIPIKSQDLAASIIFLLAYVVLLPLAMWRCFARSSRCTTLIRPGIFVLVRIATWIVRALMADGHYDKNYFIAEQILLLCGFVMLCDPLVECLAFHISRNQLPSGEPKQGLHRIVMLLKIALLVALILGIYAGSQFGSLTNSDGSTDTSTLNTVKTCRDANAIICAVLTGLSAIVALLAHCQGNLPFPQTLWLVLDGILLTIVSVYKIVLYEASAPNPVHAGTKVAFYAFNSLPEFLSAILIFTVNLKQAFAIEQAKEREKISKLMAKGEYVPPPAGSNGGYGPDGYPYQGQPSYNMTSFKSNV